MDEYRQWLLNNITGYINSTIDDIDDELYTVNRNEEGEIHSQYLGDRYEPAIIREIEYRTHYYYLFNNDIKDCEHPFRVTYNKIKNTISDVTYYSSERIENRKPIFIAFYSYYNMYRGNKKILDEYESNMVGEDGLKDFSLLCDAMETSRLKFAD